MITDMMTANVGGEDVEPTNVDTRHADNLRHAEQQNVPRWQAAGQESNAHDLTEVVIARAKTKNAKRQNADVDSTREGNIEDDDVDPLGGSPVWFGSTDQPMRGWIHRPARGTGPNSRRIVIVPGFGYEELTSGWGLRVLAEALAGDGHTVLRYDHPGTGDSSGEITSVSAWFDGIHQAVSALNFPDVTLIGVRLGATLALAAAADLSSRQSHQINQQLDQIDQKINLQGNDSAQNAPQQNVQLAGNKAFANGSITQIIAVSPIVNGRRMMRELTMLAATKKAVSAEPAGNFEAGPLQLSWATPTPSSTSSDGSPLVVGGFTYPSELRTGLNILDLLGLPASPSPRVEIVHANERATDKNFVEHLRGLGTAVYESHVGGIAKWLDTSSELAVAPQELIALLRDQLHGDSMVDAGEVTDHSEPARTFNDTVTLTLEQKTLRERCFLLGEPLLSAVLTEPIEKPSTPTIAVLLLNSGVERNIGPGRAWVSWSRTLAAEGSTVLRLDLSGVGNSGTWPGKPAFHTYGRETFDDVALGIDSLRSMGHQKIVIVGLCASAYSALGTAVQPSVVGIVSLSPQFYRCGTPGSMAEVEDTNFNRHRISQLDQKLNLRRKGAAMEELVGKRHESTAWIEGWMAQGTQVRVVFGPDDRGLRFLQWRTPRSIKRLAKTPTFALQVHPNLDHALHEASARADVFANLREFINSLQK